MQSRAKPMRSLLTVHTASALPGGLAAGLLVLWAARDGGYAPTTWYWGALGVLALLAVTLVASGARRPLGRASIVALAAFAGYTAWSYLTMAWSEVPGWALEGSNRTLLYLLVFALFLILPWTGKTALGCLLVFVLGVGAIEAAMVVHFALGERVDSLFSVGRLIAPTGYVNASAALFMINALLATALAACRRLPALLRGSLIAIAGVSLQLCVVVQSRGWLYTLPLVIVVAIVLVPDRLRVSSAAVLPLIATLLSLRTLLRVYQPYSSATVQHAAATAGRVTLLTCAGLLVAGMCIASAERRMNSWTLSPRWRRSVGALVAVLALALAAGSAGAATHGDPIGFIKSQWRGFTQPEPFYHPTSHFGDVGSARYDFWRVSSDAVAAHPIGGLGQDNFADYYIKLRRTDGEPRWTHSLELEASGTHWRRRIRPVRAVRDCGGRSGGSGVDERPGAHAHGCGCVNAPARGVADPWLARLVLGDAGPDRSSPRLLGDVRGPRRSAAPWWGS